MKKSIFFSILLAAMMALPISAFAQRFYASIPILPIRNGGISLNINIGCPGPDYVWVSGYWDWDDYYRDYVWVDGTWALPPRRGWAWTDGYWECGPNGYIWISGYWSNPYRPYSYFAAVHRNGGGYAPYFIRHNGDRGRYSCVYVSGNRRYDSNYYYSGRYNDSDRRNYVGSYDRARKENRNSSYSRDMNRGDDRNYYGSDRNGRRGNDSYGGGRTDNYGGGRTDNHIDRGSAGNNGGNRDGSYGRDRQNPGASSPDGMGTQRRSRETQSPGRTSFQNNSDTRSPGTSNGPQGRSDNSSWRTISDQPSRPAPSRPSPEERGQSTRVESRGGFEGQTRASSESRGERPSRPDRGGSDRGGRR